VNLNSHKTIQGYAQFCQDSLEDVSSGITAGMVSSVPANLKINTAVHRKKDCLSNKELERFSDVDEY